MNNIQGLVIVLQPIAIPKWAGTLLLVAIAIDRKNQRSLQAYQSFRQKGNPTALPIQKP
jgi:hypothetical protein